MGLCLLTIAELQQALFLATTPGSTNSSIAGPSSSAGRPEDPSVIYPVDYPPVYQSLPKPTPPMPSAAVGDQAPPPGVYNIMPGIPPHLPFLPAEPDMPIPQSKGLPGHQVSVVDAYPEPDPNEVSGAYADIFWPGWPRRLPPPGQSQSLVDGTFPMAYRY